MKGPTNNPETNKMFAELSQAIRESFEVDNSIVPEGYRDNRSKATSLEFMHRRHRKLNPGPSAAEIEKAEKARRVALYAEQMQADEEGRLNPPEEGLTYLVDDDKLYRKELEFCASATRAGWMTFDDE